MGQPTPEARALYYALRKLGIKCELEVWDGHKHVDLCIKWAKLNIEIDGFQHYTNARQIESDYLRSYYSTIKGGFDTIHIPNIAIKTDLNSVARGIARAARNKYYDMRNKENKSFWDEEDDDEYDDDPYDWF